MALQDGLRKRRELGASDLHVEADTAGVASAADDSRVISV